MISHLRHFARSYRRLIIIVLVVGFGAASFVTFMGFYPIIVVNGDWILARRFYLHIGAAEQYEAIKQATSTNPSVLRNTDLTVAVLNGLIEEQLIKQGAEDEFTTQLKTLEDQRVGAFLERSSAIEEESKKYGLSVHKFEKEILRPQVTRDLLAGRLFLESLRLEDWLLVEKRKASVSIFSRVFSWNGEEVIVR